MVDGFPQSTRAILNLMCLRQYALGHGPKKHHFRYLIRVPLSKASNENFV